MCPYFFSCIYFVSFERKINFRSKKPKRNVFILEHVQAFKKQFFARNISIRSKTPYFMCPSIFDHDMIKVAQDIRIQSWNFPQNQWAL